MSTEEYEIWSDVTDWMHEVAGKIKAVSFSRPGGRRTDLHLHEWNESNKPCCVQTIPDFGSKDELVSNSQLPF